MSSTSNEMVSGPLGDDLTRDLADLLRGSGWSLGNIAVECREPVEYHTRVGDQTIVTAHPTYRMSVSAAALDNRSGMEGFHAWMDRGNRPLVLGQHEARLETMEQRMGQEGIRHIELEFALRPRIERRERGTLEFAGTTALASDINWISADTMADIRQSRKGNSDWLRGCDEQEAIKACVARLMKSPSRQEREEINRRIMETEEE